MVHRDAVLPQRGMFQAMTPMESALLDEVEGRAEWCRPGAPPEEVRFSAY